MKNLMKTAAICAAVMCLLTGCKSSDYKKAMALYEDKEYEDAYEIFDELDDYKDSEKYAKKCKRKMESGGSALAGYVTESKYSTANANAKQLYTNTATICTDAEIAGYPFPDGRYYVDICMDGYGDYSMPVFDHTPTADDFAKAISVLMGYSGAHYYGVVTIQNNLPTEAYFCNEDVFGRKYETFTVNDFDFGGKEALGHHPEPVNYEKRALD